VNTSYLLERAWVGDRVEDDVLVEISHGRFTRVDVRAAAEGAPRLSGLTIPGLANCHSHAFHRALRGRTQRGRGTFWTWREQMYDAAGRLDPDSYFLLARATYREMVAAGYTSVGEFHYLHHQPDGTPYDDPNAMGHALMAAAREAGLRICLLDTCYLSSGFGRPVEGVQRRFSDGSVDSWSDRMVQLRPADGVSVGGAFHSVRAVPREELRSYTAALLHIHLSEQPAENEECLATYGVTPARLLHEAGNHLGPSVTVVHATHLTDDDIELLGTTGTNVCITPTTERDLADGIGPAARLAAAGCRITLGSDSHAVIDPFEEMRGLELDERLATQERGHWTSAQLLGAAAGHGTLGFGDAGAIAVGQRADLVTLDTTSPRTAGTGADEQTAAYAASAADVVQVVADGRVVFTRGDEVAIGRELERAVSAVWR